jgi:hypothetical protein
MMATDQIDVRRSAGTGNAAGNGYLPRPSPSGGAGFMLGGIAGAALGGPLGAVLGAFAGLTVAEVLERRYPPTHQGSPRGER